METTRLVETQLEERDGGTWVTGQCAACGTFLALRAAEDGSYAPRPCSECGAMVVVVADRSKGRGLAMKCSELMKIQVHCAGRTESIEAVARRMRDKNLGFMPVCEEGGCVVGAITDRDITVRGVAEGRDLGRTPVEQIMTAEVVACLAEDDLEVAEERMSKAKKSRIVIVDDRGRPAGVISLSDIAMVEPRANAVRVLGAVASRETHA